MSSWNSRASFRSSIFDIKWYCVSFKNTYSYIQQRVDPIFLVKFEIDNFYTTPLLFSTNLQVTVRLVMFSNRTKNKIKNKQHVCIVWHWNGRYYKFPSYAMVFSLLFTSNSKCWKSCTCSKYIVSVFLCPIYLHWVVYTFVDLFPVFQRFPTWEPKRFC